MDDLYFDVHFFKNVNYYLILFYFVFIDSYIAHLLT